MKIFLRSVIGMLTAISMSVPLEPIQAQSPRYEVLIIARKPENSSIPLKNDAGHAWISIIREERNSWKTDTTYGFWPNSNLEVNNSLDRDFTDRYLRGESLSKRGFSIRKSRISSSRANWIKNGAFREAGCVKYQVIGGTGTSCNCADYATRLWHVLSAKQDDFRVRAVTIGVNTTLTTLIGYTLDEVVDNINNKNHRTGDYLDGGKTWQ